MMRRRTFLETIGRVAAAGGGLLRFRSRRSPRHWSWVHGGRDRTVAEWADRFAQIREAGFHGVLASGGDSATLSTAARGAGLAFHRWIWTLNRNGDEWVKSNHPEWFTVNRNGESSLEKPPYVGYYKWVCPTRPEVRRYLAAQIEAVARDPAVEGVHLDYIRFPDVILPVGLWSRYHLVQDREYPEFDSCYCAVCRDTFRRRSGVDPMSLDDPASDVAWRAFRWEAVTGMVEVLAAAAHRHGKPISAAVFPTPTIARRLVRQAWDRWPLDAVFPMIYHEFYQQAVPWIEQAAREGVTALASRIPLYGGLYLPSLSPPAFGDGARRVMRSGAAGVCAFEMDGLTDPHLSAFAAAVRD